MLLSKLKVDDEDFLVHSLIERCPPQMMLRELVMNAVEAALLAPPGARRVEIGPLLVEGVAKLRVWNTGPGLSAGELVVMGDLSASIRKAKGLNENFGLGAKVASLASNPLGLRYRSCRAGQVHEMTLGRREGRYGRLLYATAEGPRPVLDVSETATAEGADLSFDWTEVVALGAAPEQDTLRQPFGIGHRSSPGWVGEGLWQRFFHLDDSVVLTLLPGAHPGAEPLVFQTIEQRFRNLPGSAAIPAADGAVLHVFHHPAEPGQPAPPAGLVGLLHQGELYGVLAGSAWSAAAASFGIPYGAREVTLLLELPAGYQLMPDTYRQFLRRSDGAPEAFTADRFASKFQELRPAWLAEALARLAEAPRLDRRLRAELSALAAAVGLEAREEADRLVLSGPLGGETPLPQVLLLRDAGEIENRWLSDRAGSYSPASGELFVNGRYPPLADLREALERALEADAGLLDGKLRGDARRAAETRLVRRLMRGLVLGLAKREQPGLWSEAHLANLLSPEALTAIAEDLAEEAPQALLGIKDRMAGG